MMEVQFREEIMGMATTIFTAVSIQVRASKQTERTLIFGLASLAPHPSPPVACLLTLRHRRCSGSPRFTRTVTGETGKDTPSDKKRIMYMPTRKEPGTAMRAKRNSFFCFCFDDSWRYFETSIF